jgi:hypothetical protein
LLLGIHNPLKLIGLIMKPSSSRLRGNVGAGEGEVVPEDAVGGAIEFGDQVVVEELGQTVGLGVEPKGTDASGVLGVAAVG